MKTILCIVCLFACLSGRAQTYSALTLATNAIPNAATNSTAGTSIDLIRQTSVTVYAFGRALTNAGTGDIVFHFKGSPDDSTYFTNAYSLTLAVNGTNTVSGFARFDVTPFKHFKHTSTENSSTNVFTNILCYVLLK